MAGNFIMKLRFVKNSVTGYFGFLNHVWFMRTIFQNYVFLNTKTLTNEYLQVKLSSNVFMCLFLMNKIYGFELICEILLRV